MMLLGLDAVTVASFLGAGVLLNSVPGTAVLCASAAGAAGGDSLRAGGGTRRHPGKLWLVQGKRMGPAVTRSGEARSPESPAWPSTPYQALPPVYAQNASLEIAWSRVVLEHGSIAGDSIMPFLSEAWEGFDINDEIDWLVAEELIRRGDVTPPRIMQPPWVE